MKRTLTDIKADIGGYPGHAGMHPALLNLAEKELAQYKHDGTIIDFRVFHVGDDLHLFMLHDQGVDSEVIHTLTWDIFLLGTEKAKELGLYGAGQDILKDAISGNVRGAGPGIAELEFTLRPAEPVIVFGLDKTSPSAFNLPIFKVFADPFTTAGLIIDPSMHDGFIFEVWNIFEHKKILLSCPEELYDLLALIGATGEYVIKRIYPKENHPKLDSTEPIVSISTEKLVQASGGTYVGKDDPVAIVRCQSGAPALGEVLEGFAFPHLVPGWMRGSHNGPLMPVSLENARCTRFDGPPRAIALGFQINTDKIVGPSDLFADPAFDIARRKANEIAEYMRGHGPFEPHRLSPSDMEYTTLPGVLKRFEDRFTNFE